MRRATGLLSASVLAALLAMSGGILAANAQERGDDASAAHGYRLAANGRTVSNNLIDIFKNPGSL